MSITPIIKPLLGLSFAASLFITACSSGGSVPATSEPTAAATATSNGFRVETAVSSTRTDRRAPTLAPSATPTEIPLATNVPTATTTVEATATLEPSATSTALPTNTRPAATATPQLAPAVYVTGFQVDPTTPKSGGDFLFHLSFLNTVGTDVNYPHWRVLILPKGQTKAVGDPAGVSKTIVAGASNQDTETWKIKVQGTCESFVGQPIWEMEDGRQVPFLQTDGTGVTLEFQVCPG